MNNDRFLITVQAIIFLCMLGFAVFMYKFVGGAAADSIGSLIVGAGITHWFKESSAIARSSANNSTTTIDVPNAVVAVEASATDKEA